MIEREAASKRADGTSSPAPAQPAMPQRRFRWWADTLFKRLFLLMWLGLVASHLVAYLTVTASGPAGGAGRPGGAGPRLPVLPSLPPVGALARPDGGSRPGPPPWMQRNVERPDAGDGARSPQTAADGSAARAGSGPFDDSTNDPSRRAEPPGAPFDRPLGSSDERGFAGPPDDGRGGGEGGMPITALGLDYGIRFVIIGLVAWFGARWLSTPMRRLARASAELGRGLGREREPPQLDVRRGTLEVQQTAEVFNAMARRLHAQFGAQALLMASISHDLRTPLARLRLRLETMTPAAQVERAVADVHEMDAMIGHILATVREQQATTAPQQVDLGAMAQALIDDLAEQGQPARFVEAPSGSGRQSAGMPIGGRAGDPTASGPDRVPTAGAVDDAARLAAFDAPDRPSRFSADAAPNAGPAPRVLGSPEALARILGNLIGNAIRHGGSATVSIVTTDDEVQVRIDDDGPGIAPQHLEAVFQPFFRVDPARGRDSARPAGSGLGLYIARDLTERNGGRLTLANRAGGGLRATASWPRALSPAASRTV